MVTKEEMEKMLREMFDDFKKDFKNDFMKDLKDNINKNRQIIEQIFEKWNTTSHRRDNNYIKSDVKDLENKNDLTMNDINNFDNVSAPEVDNNNDNMDDIDNLFVSEVLSNEQSDIDEIYDLLDKYGNGDYTNSSISEVELEWDEEFLFDHSYVEEKVSCETTDITDVTDQSSETILFNDISSISYSDHDLKMFSLPHLQYEKCESLGGAICENTVLAKPSKFEKGFARTLWDPGIISEDIEISLL